MRKRQKINIWRLRKFLLGEVVLLTTTYFHQPGDSVLTKYYLICDITKVKRSSQGYLNADNEKKFDFMFSDGTTRRLRSRELKKLLKDRSASIKAPRASSCQLKWLRSLNKD